MKFVIVEIYLLVHLSSAVSFQDLNGFHGNSLVKDTGKCPLTCSCKTSPRNNVTRWKVKCSIKYWKRVPRLPYNTIYLSMSSMPTLRNGSFTKTVGQSLRTLMLADNKESVTFEPGALRNLDHLFEMSLVGNNMEHIPNGTFNDIGNLSILILEENHFRVMPANNICLLKRLGMLKLAWNKLATINFDECFKDLETLYYVDLSDNPVMELTSTNFYGLKNSPVSELYLNHIGIQTLPIGTFKYLPHLKVLSLQDNKLTSLPSDVFDNLVNMRTLILSGNKLNSIPSASIVRLSHLESLDLGQNRIRNNTLGSEFHNMPYLNMILSENRLNYLSNTSFSSLADSKKFSLLVLKAASLKVIEANAFLPLKFLINLKLYENPLNASMLEQAFYGLRFSINLTILSLDMTNLTDISASTFRYLANTSLVHLHAQGCWITVIPSETFKFLRKLQFLKLSGNKVHTIERNAFKNLNELITLDLSRNYLSSIPNGDDVGLNTLKYLILHRNSIRVTVEQYSLRGYNQLESLCLRENSIRRISPRAFLYMLSLQELNLRNNKISSIYKDVFVGLGNLTQLDLMGNNIYDFEVTIFQHTPNIRKLDLSRNDILAVKSTDDIAKLFKPLRNLKTYDVIK